jgi:hypothetical protein
MKTLLAFSLLLFVNGCANLHTDPSPSALDSGYPTAEFTACGKLWHGMGGCALPAGEDPNKTVNLSVQGYYEGTIVANGEGCGVDLSQSYTGNASVTVPIGAVTKDCIIAFTVTPTYPQHTVIPVSGFRGYLLITNQAADVTNWVFSDFYVTGNWQRNWAINVGPATPVSAQAAGCGVDWSETELPVDSTGILQLPLQEMAQPNTDTAPCVADGFVVSPTFKNTYFDAFVAKYDPSFSPLSLPTYTLDPSNLQITVTADPVVGVVSVDSSWNEDNTGTFDFDPTKPHVLRILTSMGRSVLGIWNTSTGAFSWLQ